MKMSSRIDAGHTWDRHTLDRVRGLYVDVWISREELARAVFDVEEAMRQKCAGVLVQEARTHAVEIEERDVHMRFVEDDVPARKYRAAWRPDVTTVVLRGGEHDGMELAVQDPFEPLRAVRSPSMPLFAAEAGTEVTPVEHCIYSLAGWSELVARLDPRSLDAVRSLNR